jgi:GTPase SAR1 family protein
MQEINCYSENIPTILIGNKADLVNERVIPSDEGQRFAKERGLAYMETSAKTATNVQQAFERLVEQILSSKVQTVKKTEAPVPQIKQGKHLDTTPEQLKPASSEPKPKKKCC